MTRKRKVVVEPVSEIDEMTLATADEQFLQWKHAAELMQVEEGEIEAALSHTPSSEGESDDG